MRLTKDAWSVVMRFLELDDLKEVSVVSKQFTLLARQEMARSYWWYFTEETMDIVRPRKIFVEQDQYVTYVGYIRGLKPQYIERVHFGNFVFGPHVPIVLPPKIQRVRVNHIMLLSGNIEMDFSPFATLEKIRFVRKGMNAPVEYFNGRLIVPPGLKALHLTSMYNQPLKLPPLLERLSLGGVGHPVEFPPLLTYLDLGDNYDHPFKVPPNMKTLLLGQLFSHPIILPVGLKTLYTGHTFNEVLVLPPTLKNATFGFMYSQPITLPDGVENVELGERFNRDIVVPTSVKNLYLRSGYSGRVTYGGLKILVR